MELRELVRIEKLKKFFPVKSGVFSQVDNYVKAVDGIDLSIFEGETLPLRREMQIIFQDPYGSLNPRMKVESIVGEGLTIHNIIPRKERRAEVKRLLETVGLREDVLFRYPHEFSGGQRQR